jgi:putative hydrolase of the HAD superfamily
MRRALRPRHEVIETLRELRQRGLRLGLISGCSGDVPIVWGETPFVGLFDATVFSCEVGLRKPDVRIFRKAASELQIPTKACLYVGDGGNDELAGAGRAGMTAVLLRSSTISAPRESREWAYEVDEIASVLSLV